jgi:hypothetical protein
VLSADVVSAKAWMFSPNAKIADANIALIFIVSLPLFDLAHTQDFLGL